MTTTLYRLFDTNKQLLYIGIAKSPGRRFEQHAGDKEWWPEVATITLELFDDRVVAAAAEVHAIRNELPRHNIRSAFRPDATVVALHGDSELLPLAEAAALLGIHKDTAYALNAKGDFPLPVLRIGRGLKVSRTALDRLLAEARGEAS